MKTKKYMVNDGWDMNEEGMLRKLSDYAKEGWMLEHMNFCFFTLVKKEPQEIRFAMDYQPDISDREDYLAIFKGSGWRFVCECYGFYIFSAPMDATPIHTDPAPIKQNIMKRLTVSSLCFLCALLITYAGLKIDKSVLSFLMACIGGMCSDFFGVWCIGLLRKRMLAKRI